MMEKLLARLESIPAACAAAAEQAIGETVSAAQAEARNMVPVRSGNLRRSIRAEAEGMTGAVFTDCPYAPAVELGGRGSPARPFLYSAAMAQRQDFVRRAAQALSRSLKGGK